jgi:hypothetical protein
MNVVFTRDIRKVTSGELSTKPAIKSYYIQKYVHIHVLLNAVTAGIEAHFVSGNKFLSKILPPVSSVTF